MENITKEVEEESEIRADLRLYVSFVFSIDIFRLLMATRRNVSTLLSRREMRADGILVS